MYLLVKEYQELHYVQHNLLGCFLHSVYIAEEWKNLSTCKSYKTHTIALVRPKDPHVFFENNSTMSIYLHLFDFWIIFWNIFFLDFFKCGKRNHFHTIFTYSTKENYIIIVNYSLVCTNRHLPTALCWSLSLNILPIFFQL